MTDDLLTGDYDAFAAAYIEGTRDNAYNALLERPAMQALLPDVRGKKVLDLGCAGGIYAKWLHDQGARVTALDVSPNMIKQARKIQGDCAEFKQWDIQKPMNFLSDNSFDVIISSLTLHYIRDWSPVLADIRRLLCPGGQFLFSTHHPLADYFWPEEKDYFAIQRITQRWPDFKNALEADDFTVQFYRRPLAIMINSLIAAGFTITHMAEPEPQPEMAEKYPDNYQTLLKYPAFLVVDTRCM